jgi:hypothetical protein
VSIALDLTKIHKAEEKLRESEERLRRVIESSRTGTWDWDVRTNEVVWNDIARMKFAEEKVRDIAKFPAENPYPVMRLSGDGTILFSNKPGLLFLKEGYCEIGEKAPANWRHEVKESIRYNRTVVRKDTYGSHVFCFAAVPIREGRYVNLYGWDVTVQKQTKELLRRSRAELEEKVKERTGELAKTVDVLQEEVEQQRRAEQSLRERKRDLDAYFFAQHHIARYSR